MLKPTQFIKLLEKEIGTIIQLSKNIQPEMLNYRPKENMRTMEELMNYISGCGYNFQSYWMTDGSLSVQDFFANLRANRTMVTIDNFEQEMKRQLENIIKLVASLNDDEWQHKMVKYPWGEEAPIGEALIETTIKWLTAYKYQMMMYIKMGGDVPLTTKDVWVNG